ncbi:hypothetical protein ALPO108162_02235 [Alicyclobacillus pomorum]
MCLWDTTGSVGKSVLRLIRRAVCNVIGGHLRRDILMFGYIAPSRESPHSPSAKIGFPLPGDCIVS